MDLRQQRGIRLANSRIMRKKGDVWLVSSQSGDGTRYTVNLETETCSCPDFKLNRVKCKHIFAAAFASSRQSTANGHCSTEQTSMATRPTYPQNWPAYNAAQTTEKDRFQLLLHDLCSGLPTAPPGRGRPPIPLPDAIFGATLKVYSTMSGRRVMSDMREAHRRGWISRVPCYNTVFNILENDDLFPTFKSLVERSALPLRAVETDFAADATGFGTSRFRRWFDHRTGREQRQHEWVYCHCMCGVKTNIVTAVEIDRPTAHDSKLLPPMLTTTAKLFRIKKVSADKGYSSRKNLQAIASHDAIPYLAFIDTAKGRGSGIWARMFHYFQFRRQEFLEHYHKRSNIEATFSMMKRKFGDSLRSRTDSAMKNEALCKILCHNIVVLIHEIEELGIEAEFWPSNSAGPSNTQQNLSQRETRPS